MFPKNTEQERTQRLLFQREKDGVDEFDVLDVIIDDIIELHALRVAVSKNLRMCNGRVLTGVQAPGSQIA